MDVFDRKMLGRIIAIGALLIVARGIYVSEITGRVPFNQYNSDSYDSIFIAIFLFIVAAVLSKAEK